MLTFAISDIHGCLDELLELVVKCENYATEFAKPRIEIPHKYVFLGDYIDRGPNSAQVLDWMIDSPLDKVCLMGNHEDMYLNDRQNWKHNGGIQTMESYNLPHKYDGKRHRNWCRNLDYMHEDKYRLYVHAGFDPRHSLEDQNSESMMWIRDYFLNSEKDWGKLVVHGHTPYLSFSVDEQFPFQSNDRQFQIKPNRINIDTACCMGGHLTAAVFNDEQRDPIDFIQIARPRRM